MSRPYPEGWTEKICSRCAGKGYHHGFGEHGHDPDWCSECGGCGSWLEPPDDWEDEPST